MAIEVVIPRALYPFTQGTGTLVLADRYATVADAMSAIGERWPGVLDRVMTEQREVREHVNIFVGEANIRWANGLATPVDDGDTIMIVAAVSGG